MENSLVIEPKVSIVVPVYNTEDFLAECLQSVADQTYLNIECIVINDCSTDKSREIILDFVRDFPNIFKCLENAQNIGQGKCRNLGASAASGDYLFFLDSDDYLELDCIAKMYAKLAVDDSDFVISTHSLTRRSGRSWKKKCRWADYESMFKFSRYSLPMYVWGILHKIDFWRSNNLVFESVFAEDLLVMAKAFSLTDKISVLNDPLYVYRYNMDSLTHKFYPRNEIFAVISKLYYYFKDNQRLNDETTAFILSHFYNLSKALSSVFERRRFFQQFKKLIPELPLRNKFFAPPLIDASKRQKLKKIYASSGFYLWLKPDTRKIKRFLKKILG